MIFETIAQLLNEFFVDIQESNVAFSLGDLFDASHFSISDVFVNTQVINALHLPFELAAGYIGNCRVEGLVGAVAGAPLSLHVSDVCLVLRRKDIDWANELFFRYAKDLLIALLQSFTSPSYAKKMQQQQQQTNGTTTDASKKTFVSPAKWISSRFQAAVADMTIQLERIHIRLEGELNGESIAHGVYLSSIHLATRDTDEQILHRRALHGVTYPQTADGTRSKFVTLENLSVYCDLHADTFITDSPAPAAATSTSLPPPPARAAATPTTRTRVLERFRTMALRAFTPDPRRDLFIAAVVWLKLDLRKPSSSDTSAAAVTVAAVDVVTDALRVNVDFAQLRAVTDELAWLSAFDRQTRMRQWRPSCVDRLRVSPPVVRVVGSALLPLVDIDSDVLTTPAPERRTSTWLRCMWRFATWCVLVAKRDGNAHVVRFTAHRSAFATLAAESDDDARSHRYVELYTRSLSADALEMVVYGKKLLGMPASPRKPVDATQDPLVAAPLVPVLEPLSRDEQWELSDFVLHLPVAEQRRYRAVADATLRACKPKSGGLVSPPASPPASPAASPAASPSKQRSIDTAASAPKPSQPASPATNSPSKTSTRLPELPADTVAHHDHITRSATESALPTHARGAGVATFQLAQLHVASTSALLGSKTATIRSSPTKADSRSSPTKPAASLTHKLPPMATQRWLQHVFVPAWVLRQRVPLLNWSIGPISLCVFRDRAVTMSESTSTDADADAELSRSPRCEFLKVGIERCAGAVLIGDATSPVLLVELRLGLVHATLFSPSHDRALARNNSVATDYIKDPDDGFLYIGLRYSPQAADANSSHVDAPERWDVRGRVCVGPIKIDYNELTLQTTLASAASIPLTESVNVASATYLSILRDVARSWRALYRRFRQRKQQSTVARTDGFYSALLDPVGSAAAQLLARTQQRATKRARLQQLLTAVLRSASTFELELGGLEATLSLLTRHVEQALNADALPSRAPLFGYEDVHVALPPAQFALESCPQRSECCVRAAGARVQFRSTEHGLAAATEYLLRRLMGSSTSK